MVDNDEEEDDDDAAVGAGGPGPSPRIGTFAEYLPSSLSPSQSSHSHFRRGQQEVETATSSAAAAFLSSSQRARTPRLPRCLVDSDAEVDEGEDDDVVLPTSISSIPAECADLRELRQVVSRIERDDLVKRQQLRKQFTLLQKQESLLLEQERQLMRREEELQRLWRQVGQLRTEAKDHITTAEEARRACDRASAALNEFKDKVRDGAEVKSLLREALSQADRELGELRERIRALEQDRGSNLAKEPADQSYRRRSEGRTGGFAGLGDEGRDVERDEGDAAAKREGETGAYEEEEFSKASMWIVKLLGEDEYDSSEEFRGLSDEEVFYAAFHKQDQLKKVLEKHPGIANEENVVAALRQRLRREALQIRVYVQQRKAMKDADDRAATDCSLSSRSASSSNAASSSFSAGTSRLPGAVEEAKEEEEERSWRDDGYERLKRHCVSREILLLLFSNSNSATLQCILHFSLEEGCQRWLDLLKDAVFCHFLRGQLQSSDLAASLFPQKRKTVMLETRDKSEPQGEGKSWRQDSGDEDSKGLGASELRVGGRKTGREKEEDRQGERRTGRDDEAHKSHAIFSEGRRRPHEKDVTQDGSSRDEEKHRTLVAAPSCSSSSSKVSSSSSNNSARAQGGETAAPQADDCHLSCDSPRTTPHQSTAQATTPHPLLILLKSGKGNWLETARWLYYGIMPVGLFTPLQPSSSSSSSSLRYFCGTASENPVTAEGEARPPESVLPSSWSATHPFNTPRGTLSLVDEEGNSVLHWAFKRNAPEIISRFRLLELPGLSLSAKNKRGETPAELLPTLFDAARDRAWHEAKDRHAQERGEKCTSPGRQKRTSPVVLEAHKNLKYWRGLVFDVATQVGNCCG